MSPLGRSRWAYSVFGTPVYTVNVGDKLRIRMHPLCAGVLFVWRVIYNTHGALLEAGPLGQLVFLRQLSVPPFLCSFFRALCVCLKRRSSVS